MKDNYGINLSAKKTLIEGRLSRVLLEKGFSTFGEYLDFVFNDKTKTELDILINRLTTNHTYFMRESKHFDYLKSTVLPYLRDTVKDKNLRIWCAASSTGEEPYTLEMIVQDFFHNELSLWNKEIIASDISSRVLNIAKEGVYSLESIQEVPSTWKLNYFEKVSDNTVRVKENIRKNVTFQKLNLMDTMLPFKRKFHVIFCRNVMIYFDQPTKTALINRLYNVLEDGGYLFIGLAETVDRHATDFRYEMPAVYRKMKP